MTETQTPPAAESQSTPPYAPFSTVVSFLKKLKETVVPARVDKTLMNGMSGSGMNQLLHALRFLGAINEAGIAQPALKELVDAVGTDDWSAALAKRVSPAYADVVRDVDLGGGTLGQLREAFKAKGVSDGQVLEKCIRFYLSAAESAGTKLSPHFKVRQPRSASSKRSAASREAPEQQMDDGSDAGVEDAGEFETPAAPAAPTTKKKPAKAGAAEQPRVDQQPLMKRWPLHIPGKPMGFITVPENITEDECAFIEMALAPIKLYAKHAAKVGKGSKAASASKPKEASA